MSGAVRGRFDGVGHIVRFNWPLYAVSAAVLAVGWGLSRRFARRPSGDRVSGWRRLPEAAVGLAGFYFVGSLAVSHWIYDRSPLSRWTWLDRYLDAAATPRRIVNVHAGFDEASGPLRERFPHAELTVLDFYDPVRNPEPSIARARRAYPPDPEALPVGLDGWPVADGAADLAVLFLAAHEVRDEADRRRLFGELRRVVRPGGRVLLVEHLRDAANLAAYGPGFLHFLSEATWRRAAAEGFRSVAEGKVTPFIHVFSLEPV